MTLCPVCNGLTELAMPCPACGRPLDDSGRLSDYFSDYSPYRPIDDGKMTNGIRDLETGLCIHVGWCPSCRSEYRLSVSEWSTVPLM